MKQYEKLLLILGLIVVLTLSVFQVSALAIQNGIPDGNNRPNVCLVAFYNNDNFLWWTIGTLIAPNVVLTAGHDTYNVAKASVWFDAEMDPNKTGVMPFEITGYHLYDGRTSYTGKPYTHYDYRSDPLRVFPVLTTTTLG